MSELVDVTRNSEQLKAMQFLSPDDMYAALSYMSARNYIGMVNCAAGPTWSLSLSGPHGNTSQVAFISDWIVVVNDIKAELVPASQAGNLYTITPL